MLDQHCSRKAEEGRGVGEHAHDVGPALDHFTEPFDWIRGPDLPPVFGREPAEREDVGAGVVEHFGDFGVGAFEHPGGVTRIVENRQGLVLAAAGVDGSNTPDGLVLLLPIDPDASARAICAALRERTGLRLGVLVTDTAGRPWREGQTDIAIGAAGFAVLDDLRGTTDASGRRLDATVAAVADEIAGAADLVKGKTSGNPVAVVRGLGRLVGDLDAEPDVRGASLLQRASESDMFRLGTAEAHAEGFAAGFAAGRAAALAEL